MEKVDDEESRGFDARNVNRAKFVRLLSIDTGDRVSGTRLGNRVGITVAEFRIGIFFTSRLENFVRFFQFSNSINLNQNHSQHSVFQ